MVTTAAPYYTLRSVRFESAEDFIDEVKPYDGPVMSATLGLAMDYVTSATHEAPSRLQERGTFHAIYEHGQLILVLVQTPLRPTTHFIGYPSPPPPPLLSAACARLAKTVSPSALSGHLAGPRDALTAFQPHLPGLHISPSLHSTLVCTANLRTLPPPTSEPPSTETALGDPVARYHIRRGRPEDAPALLPLVQELLAPTPVGPPPPERILADMRAAAERRLLYVVSTAGVGSAGARDGKEKEAAAELAGYLLLGSATPLVVWIRNVFIHAAHRRRGLAGRLVGAVTRACLGAGVTASGENRSGVSVDVGVPGCGVKSSVCLRCSDPGAARVYGRCGFAVDEGATDPGTGEKLCYAYELRGVTQS